MQDFQKTRYIHDWASYTVMRMRDDVDAKRRRAREVDVCAVESDKVGTSTPNGDVHARSTSVQWRVTKSERRRHWHVDVTTQMSTYSARTSTLEREVDVLEREVDVCARTNFVTNGLPYEPTYSACSATGEQFIRPYEYDRATVQIP